MEEVATQKQTKCCKVLGWLKQIYYICCWIFVIIFVKYGTYVERNDYYWFVSYSTRHRIGIFIPFIISMTFMGMIYFANFICLCIGSNRVFKLLSNINENNSINKIMVIY